MSLIKINGLDMPEPVSYRVTLADADSPSTTRSESAIMNRNRIRADMLKIELGWEKLSTPEMKRVIGAVSPDEFTVNYFFGDNETAQMYASDRSIDLVVSEDGGTWNVSVNLIEF